METAREFALRKYPELWGKNHNAGDIIRAMEEYAEMVAKNIVSKPVLPLSGGEIITKAIDRSKDLNRSKYDGTSYRFGYMAGFEDAQSIAVGGNDR